MIRVHFTYKHVDKPWGGANNFIRALRESMLADGRFALVDDPAQPCDIVFMNQLGTGPGGQGARLAPAVARRWQAEGRRIVVRAVNLNWHAFPLGPRNLTLGWWTDRQTIALLNLADLVVFQSDYQRSVFARAGYRGGAHVVIHNGAPAEFWVDRPNPPADGTVLRLISSTASPRATKRHDLLARLSTCDGVELSHLGAWPKDLDPGRVRRLGMLDRRGMTEALAAHHAFVHAAIKDPCPNAVFEALSAGLPVLYNPDTGSSAEIVGDCGLPLDERDLPGTVDRLRSRLDELRQVVLLQRGRAAIGHAAHRYCEAFERVLPPLVRPRAVQG